MRVDYSFALTPLRIHGDDTASILVDDIQLQHTLATVVKGKYLCDGQMGWTIAGFPPMSAVGLLGLIWLFEDGLGVSSGHLSSQ